ncbi:SET domain-containing protein SmydA-8-like [Diorhabda carinulata]|uniref:SET domain-containing protein SmydA-8-like n=1 Tax=Diorhabda carinulata TaxID=1163345 RepID=UPI0025A20096|nr:SET domain-containing protein SmydA-8-like [Diorhabda carinulata]XP_057655665.1 SET domain-containing protein SmydA-8-like [Diorhabda carinulata]XP_057655666.1 SET domain-containing protein SmydA-8-like [Diorhabda carinulata]
MSSEGVDNENNKCEVCKAPSTRKCSACKSVFYCSEIHQQENWKEHKNQCRPFEESYSKDLGRYLKATRDIQPGGVIFSEIPLVFGPKPHRIQEGGFPCVGCCKLLSNQICEMCPGCLWPVCSTTCEGLNIPSYHGFECNILRLRTCSEVKSFLDFYRFDVLIVLRALYLQKANPKKWEILMKLEDHLEKRGLGTDVFTAIQEKFDFLMEHYLKPLKSYEKETGQVIIPNCTEDIIHKIYGIIDVNATELTEDVDAMILYSNASLLEHNCIPNTMQIIDENDHFRVTFRAAMAIPKGEHITTMYTHILWSTAARRDHLMETKYFKCTCKRCQDPTELGTYLSALKCIAGKDDESCGGWQLPITPTYTNGAWMCSKCKIKLPEQDIVKFINHLSHEVDKIMTKAPNKEELEDLLNKLLHFLHPNHYLLFNIKHTLIQIFTDKQIDQNDPMVWMEKLSQCDELIDLTRKLDPGNARLSLYLGVLLNERFMAQFKILTTTFDKPTQNLYTDQIKKEISEILEENRRILFYEQNTSAGRKLLEVVNRNRQSFENWLSEHKQTV